MITAQELERILALEVVTTLLHLAEEVLALDLELKQGDVTVSAVSSFGFSQEQ